MRITILLFAVCLSCCLKAQLTANAGRDTTVCAGSPVVLGGNPTAVGGTGPYRYYWTPSVGLSCDTCANPVATPGSANTYTVQITDSAGGTAMANINVNVNPLPVVIITASDTSVCLGQQVYLHASASTSGCGFTSPCANTLTSSQIGNGAMLQPGTGTQYPSIFGNYYSSCRQQIIYKASELLQALGGAKTIDGIGFDVDQFNSSAYLLNSTIKIGCSSMDSLTTWNESLLTVVGPTSVQPSAGWNDFAFSHGYYWDGVSNIVVELCFYGPGLYGNQVNKAFCTVTPNSSYIYSTGNYNQCDTTTVPIISNIRPNIRFGYCNGTLPVQNFTYNWQPGIGTDSVFSPQSSNTYAAPTLSTNYQVTITDTNGCKAIDSVRVKIKIDSIQVAISVTDATCPLLPPNGAVSVSLASNYSSINYSLEDSISGIIDSGLFAGNGNLFFPGLLPGLHQLYISDANCSRLDFPFTIMISDTGVVNANIKTSVATCGLSNGTIQVAVLGQGTITYQLKNSANTILFSGHTTNNDTLNFIQLHAGTYHLFLTGCSNLMDTITINANPQSIITDTVTFTIPHCPLQNDGEIVAKLFGTGDSVSYKLLPYNSSEVLDSGIAADGHSVNFLNLMPGEYALNLADSFCFLTDYINISAPPIPAYTGNTFTSSCGGDSTASGCINITGGSPPFNYVWSDPACIGECPDNVPAGNYSVTVSDADNCSTVIPITINQSSAPIIVTEISNEQQAAADIITIGISGGMSPYSVDWGDGNSTSEPDTAHHIYASTGTFLIIVTESNGCNVHDSIVSTFSVGLSQNILFPIKIHPNPASDQLFIESNNFAINEIEIVDVTGKQVLQQYLKGVHDANINVSGLSDGVYVINAKSNGLAYRSRFIKTK